MVQVKMASHADALEIKEALELGRERARESADVLGV
jgi:hypothetical protein